MAKAKTKTKKLAAKTAAIPGVKKLDAQTYVLKKRDFSGVEGQRLTILEAVKSAGGSVTRPALLKALGTALKTTQTPAKILAFYRGGLVKDGFVEVKQAA